MPRRRTAPAVRRADAPPGQGGGRDGNHGPAGQPAGGITGAHCGEARADRPEGGTARTDATPSDNHRFRQQVGDVVPADALRGAQLVALLLPRDAGRRLLLLGRELRPRLPGRLVLRPEPCRLRLRFALHVVVLPRRSIALSSAIFVLRAAATTLACSAVDRLAHFAFAAWYSARYCAVRRGRRADRCRTTASDHRVRRSRRRRGTADPCGERPRIPVSTGSADA